MGYTLSAPFSDRISAHFKGRGTQSAAFAPLTLMAVPVLQGTENVMSAVIKAKASVRRVVLTSSVAAMRSTGTPAPPVNPPLYGEYDWNEVRRCMAKQCYVRGCRTG